MSKAKTATNIDGDVVMPVTFYDIEAAAADPLTSQVVLRNLFYNPSVELQPNAYSSYLSSLARNPSCPSDIFAGLLAKTETYGDTFTDQSIARDVLSCFFASPLVTFEQILNIVCSTSRFSNTIKLSELQSCESVIEIFDKMILSEPLENSFFLTRMLCTPLISDEDFKSRVENGDIRIKLDNQDLLKNSRFVPHDSDYDSALTFLRFRTARRPQFELDLLALVCNENAKPDFLVEVAGYAGSHEELAYENLNYPIELSAAYHIRIFDDYL